MTMRSEVIGCVAAALLAAGCSPSDGKARAERADGAYRSAMADYAAGRLEAAVKGFDKVLRDAPGNGSARFQLACLLQDSAHDYLGALSSYREYLRQSPDGDKARFARERSAICEKLYLAEVAKKMNYTGLAEQAVEGEKLKERFDELTARATKLERDLAASEAQVKSLSADNARLRKLLQGVGGDESTVRRPIDMASARAILEAEDDEDRVLQSVDASSLRAEGDAELAAGRAKTDVPDSVRALAEDTESPYADAGNANAAKPKDREREAAKDKAAAPERPETYTVQEGETLSQIAVKFYQSRKAWIRIRDANKETISTDGRVNAGQVIRLP